MKLDNFVETICEEAKKFDIYKHLEYLNAKKEEKLEDLRARFKAGKIKAKEANEEKRQIVAKYRKELSKFVDNDSDSDNMTEKDASTLKNVKNKSVAISKELMDFIYLLSGIQSSSELGKPNVKAPSFEKVEAAKKSLMDNLRQLEKYEKDLPEKYWNDYPEAAVDIMKTLSSITPESLNKQEEAKNLKKDSLGKVAAEKNGNFVWYFPNKKEVPANEKGEVDLYNENGNKVSTYDDGTISYRNKDNDLIKIYGDGKVKNISKQKPATQELYFKWGKKVPVNISLKYNKETSQTKNLNHAVIEKLTKLWKELSKTKAESPTEFFGSKDSKKAEALEFARKQYNELSSDKKSEAKAEKLIDISGKLEKGGAIAKKAEKELYAGSSSDKVVAKKMNVPSIKKAVLSAIIEQLMIDKEDVKKIHNLGKIMGDSAIYLIPKEYINKVKLPGSNKLEKGDAEYKDYYIYITKVKPEQAIGDARIGDKKVSMIPGKIIELKGKLFDEHGRGQDEIKKEVKEILDKNLKSSVETKIFNY